MSAQGWDRVVRPKRRGRSSNADTIPIIPIVSHYGGEVKEGRNVSVRCFMHDDSRKSAVINTYDGLYFCHTCGKGGDGIRLVQEMENMGFKDAVERAEEIITRSGHALRRWR